jgi:hypothetical protein
MEYKEGYFIAFDSKNNAGLLYQPGYYGQNGIFVAAPKSILEEILSSLKKNLELISVSDPRTKKICKIFRTHIIYINSVEEWKRL